MTFLRQNMTLATFMQLVVELSWLVAAGMIAIHYLVRLGEPLAEAVPSAVTFAVLLVALNAAFGVYRRNDKLASSEYALRVLLAASIGVPIAYLIDGILPVGGYLQDDLFTIAALAFGGLIVVRHVVILPLVGVLLPHRVLVLGTGVEAQLVEASLASSVPAGLRLVGFYPLDKQADVRVPHNLVLKSSGSLEDCVKARGVHEIIVAVRQQRGGVLPLRHLLNCRLAGVEITELASFFERVHGKVPIELLKVSWLIYGDGYRQGFARTTIKRLFDLLAATSLLMLSFPVILLAAAAIALESGMPVLYKQERVGLGGRRFTVFKFRSMAHDAEDGGKARWAVARDPRVTMVGRILRRSRIDELPQLFNVLSGQMSLVGPRPERPEFVEMLAGQVPFYAVRHSVKPGVTGWAQVRYSYGATIEQSIRKLEYDLYYVKNHSLALDVLVLLETVRVVLLGEGAH
ncbi:MAG TPA: TIGR03013 family XrtA/PEP-CTERM system glycosyltransferase [Casimicrobiaceae bacterium]|nr:TIGR03013 family XrtA/PEP-CTERM system glycosyltransferase [Casimicrobiaceae bacterium]